MKEKTKLKKIQIHINFLITGLRATTQWYNRKDDVMFDAILKNFHWVEGGIENCKGTKHMKSMSTVLSL